MTAERVLAQHQWDENARCRAGCNTPQMDAKELATHQIAMLAASGYTVLPSATIEGDQCCYPDPAWCPRHVTSITERKG